MNTDLSKYDNSWYRTGAGIVKRALWHFLNALILKSAFFPHSGFKVMILSAFGAKIGKGVMIKPYVNIKYPWRLIIGDHCWIGENVWIDNLVNVELGPNVCLSQGAMLLTGNHNYKKSTFDLIVGDIKLAQGVWIGAQAVVCPGVQCHEHSILTVGSVATGNMEAFGIYQGNPAKMVKKRIID